MKGSRIEKIKEKLFPKEIAKKLPKIGSSKSIKLIDKEVITRYCFF